MKNISKALIVAIFSTLVAGAAATALAYYPILNVYSAGSGVTISISGAQPNASVVLNYTPLGSSLLTSITGTTDGSGSFLAAVNDGSVGMSVNGTVGGQSVSSGNNNYGGCGYYGCGGCTYNCGYGGSLSLSQTSLSLNSGQSSSVTVYSNGYGGTPYISSNSNSSVATASVSGNVINVYGQNSGSTNISICQNSSQCATLYVTVNGYNGGCGSYGCVGGLTLSPTSVSLTVGQTSYVTASMPIYNPSFYISSNSNSSVVSASISGTQVSLYGLSGGSSTVTVCSSGGSACGSVYVTVGGGSTSGNIWFSPSSPTLYSGQSLAVSINSSVGYNAYGYSGSNAYYISSNSNPNAVSASISGSVLNLYGNQSGSSSINVCHSSLGFCGTVYVTVNGGTCYSGSGYCGGGSLSLSQTSLTLSAGQTSSVTAYNVPALYISSNSNPSVVSAVVSGNQVNLNALTSGSSTVYVCGVSSSQCGSIYVTVNGSVLGATTANVVISDNYFTPRTITMPIGSTIVWTNNGGMSHTVTADDNTFSSGSLSPGMTFSRSFYAAGTYPYHCIFHGGSGGVGMSGVIVISGNGNGGNSPVWFSPSSVNINFGQTQAVTIYSNNYSSSYSVSSNSNPGIVTASISGSSLNLYGQSIGSSTITVCQSYYYSNCGTLYVTVGSNGGYYGNGSLSFNTTSLPLMVIGQYYSYQLQAYGGTPPYNFSLISGSLPYGLSLSPNGLISGVPSANLYATFQVSVNDNYGHSATASFSVGNGNGYYGNGGGLQYPGGGGVLGASTYPSGELISEGPTIYMVYKNLKTAFANASAFLGLGFSFNNVAAVGNSGLNNSGYTVSSRYVQHPWGTWVKSGSTVYFVHESGLIPVPDWNTLINNGGQASFIVPANSYDLRLPRLSVMTTNDSRMQ